VSSLPLFPSDVPALRALPAPVPALPPAEPVPRTVPGLGRLRLARPLAFIDLETTGLDPRHDRILEISVMKVMPAGPDGLGTAPIVRTQRLNPGMPIPPGATAIHGIDDQAVATAPPFAEVARSWFELLDDCDFAGFGVRRFDLPLLVAEFRRAGLRFETAERSVIDGKDIFHHKEPRTLKAAYAVYCAGELIDAHSAEADMIASRDVLVAQLSYYADLPDDVAALARIGAPQADPDAVDSEGKLKWFAGEACINFGKNRGRSLRDLASNEDGRGMLGWILRADFTQEVKSMVRAALDGRFPVRTIPPQE
jgi:DNA polymerase-3 subunit epsilon